MKKVLLFMAFLIVGFVNAQILQEGFEGGVIPPDGWVLETTNPDFTWQIYGASPHEGTYSADVQYDPALTPQDEKLISPEMDLSSYESLALTFTLSLSYHWAVDPNNNYDVNVLVSTDQGTTWTEIWDEHALGVFDNWVVNNVQVSLNDYAGESSVHLAFQYVGADGAQAVLDNINVIEITGEAPGCTTLLMPENESMDVDAASVTATWEAAEGAESYQFWLGTSMDALENIGSVEETTATLTGLEYSTTYYWTVLPTNISGSAEGCDVFMFTTGTSGFEPYCGPLAFTSTVEPITHVMFAGIDNATSASTDSAPHELFLDVEGDVTAGSSYDITLKGNTAGNYTNRFAVFIDWNQDGMFEGENEIIQIEQTIENSTGEDDIAAMQTITVPEDAMEGETRMRIKKIFGETNYLDPCSGASYGQAEDYTLTVSAMSVNDVAFNGVSVYPNPVKDVLYIQGMDVKQVQIFNALGQSMRVQMSNNAINVNDLAAGYYVLRVVDNKGVVKTTKFVKK